MNSASLKTISFFPLKKKTTVQVAVDMAVGKIARTLLSPDGIG